MKILEKEQSPLALHILASKLKKAENISNSFLF